MSSNTPPARSRVPYSFGPLYDILVEYFPDHRSRQNVFDVPGLARDLGLSHETLYRCVRNSEIKPRVALAVLALSHDRHPEQSLYWEDLAPFVLPDFKKFSRTA